MAQDRMEECAASDVREVLTGFPGCAESLLLDRYLWIRTQRGHGSFGYTGRRRRISSALGWTQTRDGCKRLSSVNVKRMRLCKTMS